MELKWNYFDKYNNWGKVFYLTLRYFTLFYVKGLFDNYNNWVKSGSFDKME